MKHKKYPKFEDYDFSDCREITGDELFRINGGGRIQSDQNENPPEGDSSSGSDSYTVQSGDTLSQIVHAYNQANGTNLTVGDVAALSGIENPDLIIPGQSIVFGNNEQGSEQGQGSVPAVAGSDNSSVPSSTGTNSATPTNINPSIPDNSNSVATGPGFEPSPDVMNNPQAYAYWMAMQAQSEQEGNPNRDYNVLGNTIKTAKKTNQADKNIDTISLDSRDQYRISTMLMKGQKNAIDIVLAEKKQKTASKDNKSDCYFKIYVDQPGNGNNRNTFKFYGFDNIDTGHVFIEVGNSKTGEVITRGFYPDLGGARRKTLIEGKITKGKVFDDSSYNKDKIDVEKSFSISEYDFYVTKTSILQDEACPPLYQLSNYNCTNWAVDKATKIGLNIPQTIGSWPLGGGLNPGDLGEDLR